MPLPPEFWETIDTTVKIGLGAIVAGFFTITHSIVSNKHEREKELKRRQRDILEQVAANFEQHYGTFVDELSEVRRVFRDVKDGTIPENTGRDRLGNVIPTIKAATHGLNAARSRLLLLGLDEAEEHAAAMQNSLLDFIVALMESLSAQRETKEVQQSFDAIKIARTVFYKKLSQTYCGKI